MGKEIKIRLLQLGKKQVDLLPGIRERGFSVTPPELSKFINEVCISPKAIAIREIILDLLNEWENEQE